MTRKKLITINLVLLLVFVIALMAGLTVAEKPGANKVDLVRYTIVDGEEDAAGFAVINYTPRGSTAVTVQVQVSGLLPNETYQYYTHGILQAEFTTNRQGRGHFHVNYADEGDIDPNWEVNIWFGVDHGRKVLGTPEP